MKKYAFWLFPLLFVGSFLTFSLAVTVKVSAAAPADAGDGWVESWYCNPDKGMLLKDAQDNGLVMMQDSSQYQSLLTKYPDKCLLKDATGKWMIGALYGYIDDQILNCATGYTVGRRSIDPSQYTGFVHDGICGLGAWLSKDVCCPSGNSIVNDHQGNAVQCTWWHYRCCTSSNGLDGDNPCPDGTGGEKPIEMTYPKVANAPFIGQADPVYSCPMENCLMKDVNTPYPSGESRNNLPTGQIGPNPDPGFQPKLCIKSNDSAPIKGSSPNMYCIQGTILDQDTYDQWRSQLTEYVACKAFIDTSEAQACLDCLKGHASRVYSSLGCIDTEQNALIIRIMQIGIGIVGGIGIFRLMQAALLRQTADPAKIQESWDIISSVIIGLIILLGSIVILRVIGINVLGILPLDF